MNKREFDELFEQAFDESVKQHSLTPDAEQSWRKVDKLIAKRSRRNRRLKLLPYIAASFLLGAVIFGTPAVTNAFDPFAKAVASIRDGVVSLVFGVDEDPRAANKALTPPPPDYVPPGGLAAPSSPDDDLSNSKQMNGALRQQTFHTWEEASSELAFPAPAMRYTPSDFALSYVQTYYADNEEKAHHAMLKYDGLGDRGYFVTLRQLRANETLFSGGKGEGITFETVTIGGREAYLFVTDEETASIEYMMDNVHVAIVGFLNREEILRVAAGL